jgi:L-ascorbate metabolism protein UlaG (beta-lactamase superfamily)
VLQIESVAHASLWFRASEASLLVDPFLFVDGFDARTFCLFPPVRHRAEDFGRLDYLFSSHVHSDHGHPGTLERLRDRVGCALLPAERPALEERYRSVGFREIRLLENGRTVALKPGFEVTSFWSDPVDSVLVIRADGVTCLHGNDCMLTDEVLEEIGERFDVDYAFLVYTAAQQLYPLFLSLPEEELRRRVAEREEHFFGLQAEAIDRIRARVVVPYAYAVAYFNADQLHLNGYGRDMPATFAGRVRERLPGVETRIMSHGDVLDGATGEVTPAPGGYPWSGTVDAYLSALRAYVSKESLAAFEPGRCQSVESRLTEYLRRRMTQPATPELAKRGVLLTVKGDDGERSWALDFPRRAVSGATATDLPSQVIEIGMPASVAEAFLDGPDDLIPPLYSYRLRMKKNFSPTLAAEDEVSFYISVLVSLFAPHRVGQIF